MSSIQNTHASETDRQAFPASWKEVGLARRRGQIARISRQRAKKRDKEDGSKKNPSSFGCPFLIVFSFFPILFLKATVHATTVLHHPLMRARTNGARNWGGCVRPCLVFCCTPHPPQHQNYGYGQLSVVFVDFGPSHFSQPFLQRMRKWWCGVVREECAVAFISHRTARVK